MALQAKLETIKKHAEFVAVAASGKRWVAPGFILQIGAPRPPSPKIRYGLTASRKIGNAVVRNRARRRLRALAAEILPHLSPEHDYVLIARDKAPTLPFEEMRQEMLKGAKRLKLWAEGGQTA